MSDGRLRGLDGMRGIAVLLVMLFHARQGLAPSGAAVALSAGWAGVDLFFALSGFLITGILRRTRESPRYWRNFVVRRALRILPPYALLLLLVLGPRLVAGVDGLVPWWTYPAFVSNFWIGVVGTHDFALDLTWSLSVEEQFYLLWPVVVLFLPRRWLVALCLGLLVAAPVVRAALFDPATEVTYMWTPCRIDSLAAGALAALAREHDPWRVRDAAPWVSAALLVPLGALLAIVGDPRGTLAFTVFGYTGLALGTSALVLAMTTGRADRVVRALEWRPIAHLGGVSYGAYLFHGVLVSSVEKLGLPWPLGAVALVATTWLFATLVWRTLEEPTLRLKDRLASYERVPTPEAATAET